MSSIETVDSPGLSACLSVACLALKTIRTLSMPVWFEITERQKTPNESDEGILLHIKKGELTIETQKS